MKKIRHSIVIFIIFIFLVVCAILSLFNTSFRGIFFSEGPTAETLGWEVARDKGCFHCHGSFGGGGVPNPGKDTIPSWQGFSFMMSMENEGELREWILDGAPKRLRSSADWTKKQAAATVHMPAYRGQLRRKDLRHLIAFYYTVSGIVWPADPLAEKGMQIAEKKGCFSCHGFGGRVDMPNPRSLTGRIPAWSGRDFEHLVKNEKELIEWILDGRGSRVDSNPFAHWFIQRQTIKMPAYRGHLSDEELEAIVAYINWLRDPGAPGHQPSFEFK